MEAFPRRVAFVCALITAPSAAIAGAQGVGLGVAAGASFSPTTINSGAQSTNVGKGFAWGFFVDIPLLDSFYIAPAAMLYQLDLGNGPKPTTDIDLNFKFIIPIGNLDLGGGVTTGVTHADTDYSFHYGALAYIGYAISKNLEAFALMQYKRIVRTGSDVDTLYGFGGGMFRF